MPQLIKPPALRTGDTIALIAPGDRPHGAGEIERAGLLVEQLGFKPQIMFDQHNRYSAWTDPDDRRADAFMTAWCNDTIRALWVLRGGWGAARLLPLLDYAAITARPKLLIACDEATALLVAVHQRTGLVTLHGPSLGRGALSAYTRAWLLQLLTSPVAPGPLPLLQADPFNLTGNPLSFYPGVGEGRLLGGQLTELASLLATPDAPQVAGRILFATLPTAPPYVLERHLTALSLAGLPQQAAALLLSSYPGQPQAGTTVTLTLEEALRYGVKGIQRPICYGLPVGATDDTAALPLGISARLDAAACTLELLEGVVS